MCTVPSNFQDSFVQYRKADPFHFLGAQKLSHLFVLVRDPLAAGIFTHYKLPIARVRVRWQHSLSNAALHQSGVFSPQSSPKLKLGDWFLLPSLQHGWDGESSTEFMWKVIYILPRAAALKFTRTCPYMESLDIILRLSRVINAVQRCNLTDWKTWFNCKFVFGNGTSIFPKYIRVATDRWFEMGQGRLLTDILR